MVDDDDEDIYLTRRAFCGYCNELIFDHVHSGVEMFDYLARCGTTSEAPAVPDMILLDINLPKENGFTILVQLRNSSFSHLPVSMLTTSSAAHDIQQAYQLGACSYLCKSPDKQGMQDVARHFCDYWFNFVKLPIAA